MRRRIHVFAALLWPTQMRSLLETLMIVWCMLMGVDGWMGGWVEEEGVGKGGVWI